MSQVKHPQKEGPPSWPIEARQYLWQALLEGVFDLWHFIEETKEEMFVGGCIFQKSGEVPPANDRRDPHSRNLIILEKKEDS